MKKISDYIFYDSWERNALNLRQNEECLVLMDIGELKKGDLVRYIGYSDVDNHYGIFVFVDSNDRVLEVSGDFAGPAHYEELRRALSKQSTG